MAGRQLPVRQARRVEVEQLTKDLTVTWIWGKQLLTKEQEFIEEAIAASQELQINEPIRPVLGNTQIGCTPCLSLARPSFRRTYNGYGPSRDSPSFEFPNSPRDGTGNGSDGRHGRRDGVALIKLDQLKVGG
ncbi:hypothetical protein K438DRAFT_1937012 [Mycena galopus ATCC 62051]|nr:hypothetical protein K438DRAFT_1937012 [Mycena galopus ATCC 62051]